jgi:hypothetical protein
MLACGVPGTTRGRALIAVTVNGVELVVVGTLDLTIRQSRSRRWGPQAAWQAGPADQMSWDGEASAAGAALKPRGSLGSPNSLSSGLLRVVL